MIKHLVILLAIFSFTQAFKEWWDDPHAVDLNKDNFFDYVGQDKYVIVKFYTKWCKYCKLMVPDFTKFEEWVAVNRKDVIIARVDGDISHEISELYEVQSYPKVLLFSPWSEDVSSIHMTYRTFEGFRDWLSQYPPIKQQTQQIPKQSTPQVTQPVQQQMQQQVKQQMNTNSNQNQNTYADSHKHNHQAQQYVQNQPSAQQVQTPQPVKTIQPAQQIQQTQPQPIVSGITKKDLDDSMELLKQEIKFLNDKLSETKEELEEFKQIKTVRKINEVSDLPQTDTKVSENSDETIKKVHKKVIQTPFETKNSFLSSLSTIDFIVIGLCGCIFIAALITAKKIFSKA
jgi:thiol-disulfide isomerase/thioredoxin